MKKKIIIICSMILLLIVGISFQVILLERWKDYIIFNNKYSYPIVNFIYNFLNKSDVDWMFFLFFLVDMIYLFLFLIIGIYVYNCFSNKYFLSIVRQWPLIHCFLLLYSSFAFITFPNSLNMEILFTLILPPSHISGEAMSLGYLLMRKNVEKNHNNNKMIIFNIVMIFIAFSCFFYWP